MYAIRSYYGCRHASRGWCRRYRRLGRGCLSWVHLALVDASGLLPEIHLLTLCILAVNLRQNDPKSGDVWVCDRPPSPATALGSERSVLLRLAEIQIVRTARRLGRSRRFRRRRGA